MSEQKSGGRLGPLAEIIFNGLVTTLLTVAIAWIEVTVLDRFGSSSINAVTDLISSPAFLHRAIRWPANEKTKENTAVVLYDDQKDPTIDDWWPPKYGVLSNLAVRAWCDGAAAVVFDIHLTQYSRASGASREANPRAASPNKAAALDNLDNKDTEDAFAATLDELQDPGKEAARKTLAETCNGRRRAGVQGFQSIPVLVAPWFDKVMPSSMYDHRVGTVLDQETVYTNQAADDRVTIMAAFEVLSQICARSDPLAARCRSPPRSVLVHDSWTTPPDAFAYANSNACVDRHDFRNGLAAFWKMALNGPLTDWPDCPPVLTLSAAEFSGANFVADTLVGKAVFIGARVAGSDAHNTAFHADLPGVYIHALVAEDLLAGTAKAPVSEWEQFGCLFAVLLVAEILLDLLFVRFQKPVPRRRCRNLVRLGAVVGIVVFTLQWPVTVMLRLVLLVLLAYEYLDLELLTWLRTRARASHDAAHMTLVRKLAKPSAAKEG